MTAPASPNRELLERAATRLRPVLAELVFVGGHVAELLVTDPAATRTRPTDDVDVIVRVTTRGQYHRWEERLRALGFSPDTSPDAPICRHRAPDGVVLDLMPTDESILGFSNRWYPAAIESAEWFEIAPGLRIRIASAPAFLGTKWVALDQRGRTCGTGLRREHANFSKTVSPQGTSLAMPCRMPNACPATSTSSLRDSRR